MTNLSLRYAATSFALALLCGVANAQTAQDLAGASPPANAVWVETLDLSKMTQGWGSPGVGKSVGGNPIALDGTVYAHGIGTHAASDFLINLNGDATHFGAVVGVDDEEKTSAVAAVKFEVVVDGKVVDKTGVMHGGDQPILISVDLTGAKMLDLKVVPGADSIDFDHADWAGAEITLTPGATVLPAAATIPIVPPRMIIPPPDPKPEIHGATITGATPGHPFLFLIPATGHGPLTYFAAPLPKGLAVDSHTGVISGTLVKDGTTIVHLTVRGSDGTAKRDLTIVGGNHPMALTPPMGWNSWNVWAGQVNEDRVQAAADEMIATGLAQHGYQYINIDDTWEAGRDAQGNIQTNSKFPDMAGLGAYIHGKGLKFGIYSSPGPKTCGGYTGSYQHEQQDAQSYAGWGVDYLKYDWCSYGSIDTGNTLAGYEKPYIEMHDSLMNVNRDILFSFCQYGMGDVWKWGAAIGGNTWRTTGDIQDNWNSMRSNYEAETDLAPYAGPGHWNDPDMLMVGWVGFGNPHPTQMTPNEQITHISMWAMLAAPLLIGCDMTKLDKFTIALLDNDDMIAIDQDPLGKEANKVQKEGDDAEVWARPLADGTHAVALVNCGDEPQTITASWAACGITGKQPVRDLWLHQNVGLYSGSYSVLVPTHGCVLLKIGKPR